MKDFFTLKILDRLQFIFKILKIDYPVLRKILQVKFTMDARRVPTAFGNSSKYKEDKNYFLTSLLIYSAMGLFTILPFSLMVNNHLIQMSLIFGILMFFITSTVIADFSTVLLDVRDKAIILTKPVEAKTLSIAKFIHVFNYLFSITFALTGLTIIALFIKYTVVENITYSLLFLLLFVAELVLLNLIIVILTTLLYLFILKFFSGEKLKDIINYVQIIMIITITVGYQLIGRLIEAENLFNIYLKDTWYQYLLVPVWFGAPFALIFEHNLDISVIIMSLLVVILPIISFIVYLKLIPTFEASLLKLNQTEKKRKYRVRKFQLAKYFIHNHEEMIFYKFCLKMMSSERDFKLRVYPSLGFAIIFPFIFLFQGQISVKDLADSKFYFYLYFSAIMLPPVVMMLKYSKNYKGSWIYQVVPINNMNAINKGSLKAFIIRLLLPIYLIESTVFLFLFNYKILPDLIVIFLTMLTFTVICYRIVGDKLPFSESFDNYNKGQAMIVFLLLFILGIFVLFHLLATFIPFGIYIYLGLIFIINLLVWKFSFRRKHNGVCTFNETR